MIYINTRSLSQRVTGVQRYLREILHRLPEGVVSNVQPDAACSGIKAHLWEQLSLPVKVNGGLLWSPCNTGPVFYQNQVVTIHDMAFLRKP
ncbi:glycosyltransferase family protein [Piscirickettsia litoralis]|uniref:hypothetical protein n=1 Tax=Piscirickettsia litoralis TaxID=1891921 RepID=UPI0009817479|nr:hypothetical protein [Piscirickettsia litoralis]